jgi:hypothetical protein
LFFPIKNRKNPLSETGHNCRYFASQGRVTGLQGRQFCEYCVKKVTAIANNRMRVFTLLSFGPPRVLCDGSNAFESFDETRQE